MQSKPMGMDDGILWRLAAMHPLWRPVRANRNLDWSVAWETTAVGLWLVFPGMTFSPLFRVAAQWFPETIWGLAIIVAGLLHVVALRINGARDWTPRTRIWALFAGIIVIAPLATAIALVHPASIGLCFLVVLLGKKVICIGRAARDETHLQERRAHGIPT